MIIFGYGRDLLSIWRYLTGWPGVARLSGLPQCFLARWSLVY